MNALVKLEGAARALSEARTLDEVKQIRDVAEAARQYARAVKLGLEAQNNACEIKLRAERRGGELLAEIIPHNGGRPEKLSHDGTVSATTAILPDLGINRNQSSRWQAIAALPEDCFEQHIVQVKDAGEELTTAGVIRLAKTIERQEMVSDKRERPLPFGQYRVICADPPWQYQNSGFDEAANNLYPTMPLDDICALPVSTLATHDTVLFLWATNPLLPEALQVLDAWGFTYKTNLAWIKDQGRGKGWYLRSKHELLLIGVRPETPHPVERPDSCFEADRGSVHSRKPQAAYDIIERMYPGPRIELFARSPRPGWDVWGNEPDLQENR